MVEIMEIPKGFKKTEIGIIPDDWYGVPISQIFNFKQGVQCPVEKQYPTDTKGLKRFIRIIDLTNPSEPVRYIEDPGSSHHVKRDDLFMVRYGSPGLLGYRYEGVIANNLFRLLPKKDISNSFYFHYLKFIQDRILGISGSSTMPAINFSTLSSLPVVLPPTKAEQNAIAEALNDADALITELEKLIAKKKAIKQGAMQELLKPKDGWEVKTIGEIAIVGRGRVISHKEISKSIEGKYPVYSSQTFNNGIMGYLDSYDFDGEYLTWTTDGVYAGKVYHRNGQFNCTNVCGTIKLKKDYAPFIAYLLDTITPDHVSRNLANPKLMNDPMKRIEIPLPNHEEQIHIAQILSDMDAEIASLEKKLDKYKMLKQGMMQNLLTGKIRLI